MSKYEVILEIEVTKEKKKSLDKEYAEMGDEEYIEQELGWCFESFSGSDIVSIKRRK